MTDRFPVRDGVNTVGREHLQLAIQKLAERGVHLAEDSPPRLVAEAIALLEHQSKPTRHSTYADRILLFLRPVQAFEPRPFQPLNYAKAMGPVLERINPDRETKHSAGRLFNRD